MRYVVLLFAAFLFITLLPLSILGQIVDEGFIPVEGGTQYLVAFPRVQAESTEKPLPKPLLVKIVPRDDGSVRIVSQNSTTASINYSNSLQKGDVLHVPINLTYMVDSAGSVSDLVLSVVSDVPIDVYTESAWQGNGEVIRHLPVTAWGTAYRTANTFTDRTTNIATGAKVYGNSMALVIATHDNTTVTVDSKLDLETSGKGLQQIAPQRYSVSLDSGEVVWLRWKEDEATLRDWNSDPSGTAISADHPIGVITGATKNAIMRMPDHLPPTGMFKAQAHFVRNQLAEAALPDHMASTFFVTRPVQYTPTRNPVGEAVEFGIDNDTGDVIRFVAMEDETIIRSWSESLGQWVDRGRIDAGESWLDTACSKPTYWSSTKPVHAWQYGKSYAKILVTPGVEGSDVQGHPTVESGQPMLMSVPGVDRWITEGSFRPMEGMDNFLSMVFRTEDTASILVDGRTMGGFGFVVRPIRGTEYSTMSTAIGTSFHRVSVTDPDVRFMAWSYGSLDGLQQGRSYGSPIGVGYASESTDSVTIVVTDTCSTMTGTVHYLDRDQHRARVASVGLVTGRNVAIGQRWSTDSTYHWTLVATKPYDTVSATVRIVLTNGHSYTVDHSFVRPTVEPVTQEINFGEIHEDSIVCRAVTIRNPLAEPMSFALSAPQYFTVEPSSAVLPPGAEITFNVCTKVLSGADPRGSIDILANCYSLGKIDVQAISSLPKITVYDVNFGIINGTLPSVTKPMRIVNQGRVPLELRSVSLDDTTRISIDDSFLPITVQSSGEVSLNVTYRSDGGEHSARTHRATFQTNRTDGNATGNIIINAVTSVDEGESARYTVHPSPIDRSHATFSIAMPTPGMTVRIIDASGRTLSEHDAATDHLTLPTNVFPAGGLYIFLFTNGTETIARAVTVL